MMTRERFRRWLKGLPADLGGDERAVMSGALLFDMSKSQVGLASVDNTADAAKPVSAPQQSALNLKANIASPTFTGIPAAPTAAPGTNTTQLSTTAFATTGLNLKANIASPTLTGVPRCPTDSPGSSDTIIANTAFVQTELGAVIPPIAQTYRTLFEASGSHTAGITPDTFLLGNGNPVVASGADSSFPIKTFSLQSADYPSIATVTPKLRLRAQLITNATDPSCKYFFRLYPVDSVAGGTGAVSITLGSPIVESEAGIAGPSPSTLTDLVSADFELPVDGVYVVGVEITHNMAANSHVVFSAQLQIHNA